VVPLDIATERRSESRRAPNGAVGSDDMALPVGQRLREIAACLAEGRGAVQVEACESRHTVRLEFGICTTSTTIPPSASCIPRGTK
jgi:hypothetical protein